MDPRQLKTAHDDVKNSRRADGFLAAYQDLRVPFETQAIAKYLPDGGTLLDVGTGAGVVPEIFASLGASVITVDYSAHEGCPAFERLSSKGVVCHEAQVGVEQLPIDDESIDVVFSGNVIEHLPHSCRPFLLELKRTLKPGGHIILDTKNAVDLKTRIKMLFGISNWPVAEYVYNCDVNVEHHKEYTLGELAEVLEMAGFKITNKFAYEVFFRKSLKKMGAIRRMGVPEEHRSEFGSGFNPFHPYEYGRLIALQPSLRSDILVAAQK